MPWIQLGSDIFSKSDIGDRVFHSKYLRMFKKSVIDPFHCTVVTQAPIAESPDADSAQESDPLFAESGGRSNGAGVVREEDGHHGGIWEAQKKCNGSQELSKKYVDAQTTWRDVTY